MNPDGLTDDERGIWRALVDAIGKFAERGSYAHARAIARLGRQAMHTPVPKPRGAERMQDFRRLAETARGFDKSSRDQVTAKLAALTPLAALAAAALDGLPAVTASALPTGDRD